MSSISIKDLAEYVVSLLDGVWNDGVEDGEDVYFTAASLSEDGYTVFVMATAEDEDWKKSFTLTVKED